MIFTTALFSMFMSNTATTAMMIALLNPFFLVLEDRPNLTRKCWCLRCRSRRTSAAWVR